MARCKVLVSVFFLAHTRSGNTSRRSTFLLRKPLNFDHLIPTVRPIHVLTNAVSGGCLRSRRRAVQLANGADADVTCDDFHVACNKSRMSQGCCFHRPVTHVWPRPG